MAKYTAKTGNGEVKSVTEVEVEIDEAISKKSIFTLEHIDRKIQGWQEDIDRATALISKWNIIRTEVDVEAKKVKLKE